MTTVEAPLMPDETSPPRNPGGRPRVGTGNGSSKQASIYFTPDQLPRMKTLTDRLAASRNRQVVRAVNNLLEQHGRDTAPPIPDPKTAAVKVVLRQWIPESIEQTAALAALAQRWGLDDAAPALRIAVELLLRSEGIEPLPVPEPAAGPATPTTPEG